MTWITTADRQTTINSAGIVAVSVEQFAGHHLRLDVLYASGAKLSKCYTPDRSDICMADAQAIRDAATAVK